MICLRDESDRTNNNTVAFHRGAWRACSFLQPQMFTIVMLIAINVERESMLRFDAQRSEKVVQQRDKWLYNPETSHEYIIC